MKRSSASEKISLYDLRISRAAVDSVRDSLNSGWLSAGPKAAAFEKAICELTGVRYGVAVGSATAGLQTALASAGAERGREVVTTPFTFVATVEAILATGARPVFADIDPYSLNIDPESVAKKISKRTVAVMPVDIGGYPVDYSAIRKICRNHKIALVADNAHAIGGAYKGKPVPGYSDVSVISFHATKNLVCGEGGIVLSNRKQLIDHIRLQSRHGLTSTAFQRKGTGKWEYDAVSFGFKGNMSELNAAVGLGQLTVFEREQLKRTQLAERYQDNLFNLHDYVGIPVEEKDFQHGWHLFIIRLNLSSLKITRNQFIDLMARQGIECGVHYKPVFELSVYRKALALRAVDYPHAALAGKSVVTLPLHPHLRKSEVDRVCEAVSSIAVRHGR